MLVLLFCKLFEHYSQTNIPITFTFNHLADAFIQSDVHYKDKAFQGNKKRKKRQIFRPKWAKIKIFVIILSFLLKNKNKDTFIHSFIPNTHNIQIVLYFQVQ